MKNTTGNNFKLGLFVSTTIALFIAGVYFIGDRQQMFSRSFHIYGYFKNIDGLQVGNNVRYSGINIGVIGSIHQISDTSVQVAFVINESSHKFIKKNVNAVIGTDGLMGNKIVSLVPGPSGQPVVNDNDIINTIKPVSMDEIMSKIKITADNAADISEGLAAIMDNISEGRGTVGKLFMDTSFANNIDKTIVNIKQGTGGFKRNMDAASHNFLLKGFFKRKERRKKMDEQN
jgi:phospholipid/cholesterol/gamma-HCH transport system substrate-binding protein